MKEENVEKIKEELKKELEEPEELYPLVDWEKTPTIFGRVIGVRDVETAYGSQQIVDIEDFEKNKKAFFMTTVLKSQFQEKDIRVGDVIGVKFLGVIKNYKNFKVAVIKE